MRINFIYLRKKSVFSQNNGEDREPNTIFERIELSYQFFGTNKGVH